MSAAKSKRRSARKPYAERMWSAMLAAFPLVPAGTSPFGAAHLAREYAVALFFESELSASLQRMMRGKANDLSDAVRVIRESQEALERDIDWSHAPLQQYLSKRSAEKGREWPLRQVRTHVERKRRVRASD